MLSNKIIRSPRFYLGSLYNRQVWKLGLQQNTMDANQKDKKIIRRNRRLYIAEGLYFITSVTNERNSIFQDQETIELLRQILRNTKKLYPFIMHAYVFLPDHFHLLIKPESSVTISEIMHSFKRNFSLDYKKINNITESVNLWQYGSYDHVIRDEDDYNNHLDYIHYNPVKHGYTTKPEDHRHSSYVEYINKGWYEIGWGHKEPENLNNMDFE